MSIASSIPLSIVIPVYNEALNLPTLFARLYPVLDAIGRRYEIIFTNDGSADRCERNSVPVHAQVRLHRVFPGSCSA